MTFIPIDAPAGGGTLQLVVTLGPASASLAGPLAAAGATAFRLNASHMEPGQVDAMITTVRRSCPDAPIVVDLQGAKMRIEVREPLDVSAGQLVRLALRPDQGDVTVPHEEFFGQARPADTVSVDDGRVRLALEAVAPDAAVARALNAGRLLTRKGINVEQHPVRLQGLTRQDRLVCDVVTQRRVAIAYSFMTDGHEAAWLRAAAPGCPVVGKVERREATECLAPLSRAVDAVWICRGDLGAQLGLGELARFVASIVPGNFRVPLLMAGQVLEHLTDHPAPTRSEACHVYDLVARGYAGIVLSDETAIGRDPVHATGVAADLLASARA